MSPKVHRNNRAGCQILFVIQDAEISFNTLVFSNDEKWFENRHILALHLPLHSRTTCSIHLCLNKVLCRSTVQIKTSLFLEDSAHAIIFFSLSDTPLWIEVREWDICRCKLMTESMRKLSFLYFPHLEIQTRVQNPLCLWQTPLVTNCPLSTLSSPMEEGQQQISHQYMLLGISKTHKRSSISADLKGTFLCTPEVCKCGAAGYAAVTWDMLLVQTHLPGSLHYLLSATSHWLPGKIW